MDVLFTVIWMVGWPILSYRMAKNRNLNAAIWAAFGIFGPWSAIILVFKRKRDASGGSTSFADQAVDSIRSVRYSVDNISSKFNESSQGQSVNKIVGAMIDAFKRN